MLRFVTLTGADETVRDPNQMAELSREFPFLEWGILIGSGTGADTGGHRFPSIGWIDWLTEVKVKADGMRLSLHICGRYLRDIVENNPKRFLEIVDLLAAFDRCQLNFHGEAQPGFTAGRIRECFETLLEFWKPEIIFQLDGVNEELWRPCVQMTPGFSCSGLFDKSHGAGVSPKAWPTPLLEIPCGYAGGLGPDNIVPELGRIRSAWAGQVAKFKPIWVDMETKLFNDDGEFSLDICRDVASKVAAENRLFPGLIEAR